MRLKYSLILALAAGLMAGAGCNKGPTPAGLEAQVDVLDASKLRPAFETAPAETQAQVNKVMLDLGSSDYVAALAGLESLTNSASVTEAQKQVVANLSQQIQNKLAKAPPQGQ